MRVILSIICLVTVSACTNPGGNDGSKAPTKLLIDERPTLSGDHPKGLANFSCRSKDDAYYGLVLSNVNEASNFLIIEDAVGNAFRYEAVDKTLLNYQRYVGTYERQGVTVALDIDIERFHKSYALVDGKQIELDCGVYRSRVELLLVEVHELLKNNKWCHQEKMHGLHPYADYFFGSDGSLLRRTKANLSKEAGTWTTYREEIRMDFGGEGIERFYSYTFRPWEGTFTGHYSDTSPYNLDSIETFKKCE